MVGQQIDNMGDYPRDPFLDIRDLLHNHPVDLKSGTAKYSALILGVILLSFFSCTPAGNAPAFKKDIKPEPVEYTCTPEEIKKLISAKIYTEAEKQLAEQINKDPKNIEYRRLFALLYFKTENFSSSEKHIRYALAADSTLFDYVNENIGFDLYYIFVTSLLRQNKPLSAAENFSFIADPTGLNAENRLMYDYMLIEFNYRSDNLEGIEEKIQSILKNETVSQEQKLNLYYILAAAQVKLDKTDSALDNAIFLILNDYDFKYTRKIKRLLDGIVDNSNEDLLSAMKPKIADGYRELARRAYDNVSLTDRIMRSLNSLENETVIVDTKTADDKRSYISKIKLFADKNITSVYITSKDSVYYVNPPLFDGKTLTMKIPGKSIMSNENFSKSPKGSGIESVQWSQSADTLVFKVNLTDNYDINIERSSGEAFEKSDKINDRYSLKVNVILPEQTTAPLADFDFNEEKYTIVIDPGHGGDDPGALSVKTKSDGTKYTESELNLMLSKGLKKYLEDNGYRVFLTRDRDYYPSLHERNRIAQNRNADMFLSIHLNSASPKNKKFWQSDRYIGAEMIVRESLGNMPEFINFKQGNREAWKKQREKALRQHKKLSEVLAKTIPAASSKPYNVKRKIKPKNLVIFSGMTIPHALIEAGFIINNGNLKYILSEKGQNEFYKGIFKGIEEYRKSSF
jgi:N-acetylmuramoyl-L-alanine amidase